MNLPLFIARRYFFSKKSQRAINVVSLISMLGVLIGSGALIVVLSVFNGFESLVVSLYNSFDPQIKITAVEGKTFSVDSTTLHKLKNLAGVRDVSVTLEENALVKYHDKQYIVTLKGVDEHFGNVSGVDTMIADGKFLMQLGDSDFAVVGGAIAYNLQINLGDFLSQLDLYVPKKEATSLAHPEEAFNRRFITPSGIFAVQQEFDSKYIIVPLRFARDVLNDEHSLSSVEVALQPNADYNSTQAAIKSFFGNNFKVQSRLEQHALLYRIMKSEKWAVFLILAFILLIATFNIVGSLTMLIIEKQKDVTVLFSMGAAPVLIRKIFMAEGLMITFIGALIGLILGAAICFLQQRFGLVKLSGSGTFIIDAYPVNMQLADFFYVFVTVFVIGFVAAWYPAKKLVERKINLSFVRVDE